MKAVWQGKLTQTAARYGEHAPMAAVCCNACRTCATTNIFALALAGLVGSGAAVARLFRSRSNRKRPRVDSEHVFVHTANTCSDES